MIRSVMFAIAMGCSGMALGAEASSQNRVDFSQPILDFDGQQIAECPEFKSPPNQAECARPKVGITLGILVARALQNRGKGDDNIRPEEYASRGNLALKLYKGGQQVLTPEQVVTIKQLSLPILTSFAFAQVCGMVDPTCGK